MKWLSGLVSLGGPLLSGVLGWLVHGVKTDGSADLFQTALITVFGAGSAITIWLTVVQTGWKNGGGKLDGQLDAKEIEGIFDAVLDKLGLKSIEGVTDALAPKLAELLKSLMPAFSLTDAEPLSIRGETLISGMTATQLVDAIKAWDVDDTEDPTSSALYGVILDLLSEVVRNDADGSKAAAEIRAALHRIQFPVKKATAVAA